MSCRQVTALTGFFLFGCSVAVRMTSMHEDMHQRTRQQ